MGKLQGAFCRTTARFGIAFTAPLLSLFLKENTLLFYYVYDTCISVYHLCALPKDVRRECLFPGPGLQTVVKCHVGPGK